MNRGLGTQLRHLLELLDGAVAETYERAGLNYRPRYFPVMQAILARGPLSVTQIAETAGITQPAATQTIALMVRDGLVVASASQQDNRQKSVDLSPHGRDLLPQLQVCWSAVSTAATRLDAELPFPLSDLLDSAIEALTQTSFASRIQNAQQTRRVRRPNRGNGKPVTTASAKAVVRQSSVRNAKKVRSRFN